MEENELFVTERASPCNKGKRGRISVNVFGWDDFGRDRKGKRKRGEKKLFWVAWLEWKRGDVLVGPKCFLPVPIKKINSSVWRELWRDNWSRKRVDGK